MTRLVGLSNPISALVLASPLTQPDLPERCPGCHSDGYAASYPLSCVDRSQQGSPDDRSAPLLSPTLQTRRLATLPRPYYDN